MFARSSNKGINLQSRTGNWLYISVAFSIWIFLLFRAAYTPALMDEVMTFFQFIQTGRFQPHYSQITANNHLLNSLFGRLAYLSFGDSIFVLRLPNLIAFLLYAYYGFRIYKELQGNIARISLIILLFFSLQFISFFNICRGYGLSFAFLLGVFYHINKLAKDGTKHFHAALILNSLSVLANLSLLSWSPMLSIISILLFLREKQSLKAYIFAAISTCVYIIAIWFAIDFAILLNEHNAFFLEGGKTFFEAIFIHLSNDIGMSMPKVGQFVLAGLFLQLLIIYLSNARRIQWRDLIFPALFFGGGLIFFLMHQFLGINYPISRASVQIYLLLTIALVYAIDKFPFKYINYLIFIPGAGLIYLFFTHSSLHNVFRWRIEAIPEEMVEKAAELNKNREIPLTVSCDRFLNNTWNYYNFQNQNSINQSSDEGLQNSVPDLLLLSDWSIEIPNADYDTLLWNAKSKHLLLIRKEIPDKWTVVNLPDVKTTTEEFLILHKINIDSGSTGELNIGINYRFERAFENSFLWIVFSSSSGSVYNALKLQMIKNVNRQLHKNSFNFHITPADKDITIYVWNPHHDPYSIKDFRLFIEEKSFVFE